MNEQHKLVLVVDDMPDSLSMLTDALNGSGYTVLVALGGKQALKSAEKMPPAIVLMDAMMPEMDGFETCRRIKQLPQMDGTPVIFMTGLSDTGDVVRGLEAGGVDYVTKPVNVQELLARIRVHLSTARMTSSARRALDATGRSLMAVDQAGQLCWATPQASTLMTTLYSLPASEPELPVAAVKTIRNLIETGRTSGRSEGTLCAPGCEHKLHVDYIGQVGENEFLLRLSEMRDGQDEALLRKRLGLTGREADVLIWLTRGKANRDIAAILHLSPRTVDKHLEQIYTKLGVENRTSAVAVAMHVFDAP